MLLLLLAGCVLGCRHLPFNCLLLHQPEGWTRQCTKSMQLCVSHLFILVLLQQVGLLGLDIKLA
jgi:hypothetical protein